MKEIENRKRERRKEEKIYKKATGQRIGPG
jgi:hypothetical protein